MVPKIATKKPVNAVYGDVITAYSTYYDMKLPNTASPSHQVTALMKEYLATHTLEIPEYDGVNPYHKNVWDSLFKMFKKPILDLDQVLWARARKITYRRLRIALVQPVSLSPEYTPDSVPGLWWSKFGFRSKDEVLNSTVFWEAYSMCVSGERPFPPYKVAGKRELLHKSDLLNGKIRTFLMESTELLVENSFLFGGQDEAIKRLQPGYIRYGVSFQNGGFHRMIMNTARVIWFMWDVSGWDRCLSILDDVMDMRKEGLIEAMPQHWYMYEDRFERAREAYVCHEILLPNGDVVKFRWSQVSGGYMTTSNNCIAHQRITDYGLVKACPEATDEQILEQGGNLYGDDILGSVTLQFRKMGDEAFVSSLYKSLGMTIKAGTFKSAESPVGMSFLGGEVCSVVIHGDVFFIPSYNRNRVLSGLQYTLEPLRPDDELMKAFSLLQLGWKDCYNEIAQYIAYLFYKIPTSNVKRSFLDKGIPSRESIMSSWAGLESY